MIIRQVNKARPVDTDGQSDADKADDNPTNTQAQIFTGSGAATSVGGESDRQQDDGTTGSSFKLEEKATLGEVEICLTFSKV